jgi:hypothetical protein
VQKEMLSAEVDEIAPIRKAKSPARLKQHRETCLLELGIPARH